MSTDPVDPTVPVAFGADPVAPARKPRKKRSVTTLNLYAAATLVAVVGGTIGGYTVQALRPATPLPGLRVTQPLYPASPVFSGVAAAPLPAAQDDAAIVDGDLTKVLLPTPSGASIPSWGSDHAWMLLTDDASLYQDPATQFTINALNVRRVADTVWDAHGTTVEIRITQYLPGASSGAYNAYQDAAGDASVAMPTQYAVQGWQTNDGSSGKTDYAVGLHGDCLVQFWVSVPSGYPSTAVVDSLVSQQMARL